MKCKKCGSEFEGKFCPECGESAQEKSEQSVLKGNQENGQNNGNTNVVNNAQNNNAVQKNPLPTWAIVLLLIVFFPLGLILMWVKSDWKKITKIVVTIIFAVLCVISITNMSNASKNSKPSSSNTISTSSQGSNETEAMTKSDSTEPTTKNEEIKQLIYDDNDMKVYYMGIERATLGKSVKLYFENNGDDSETVQVRDFSANGFAVDTTMSANIAAGKKKNDNITILKSSLDDNNIKDITQIEFTLKFFNSDSFMDSFESDKITIDVQ